MPPNIPPPSPETRPILPKDAQEAQNTIQGVNLESPDAKTALQNRVAEHAKNAGLDDAHKQDEYRQAIEAAARQEFTLLTTTRGKTPEQAFQSIQQAFSSQGVDAHFSLDFANGITVEAHAKDFGRRMEQEGFSPEQRAQIQQAFDKAPPSVCESVMRLAEQVQAEGGQLQPLVDLVKEVRDSNIFVNGFRSVMATLNGNARAINADPSLTPAQKRSLQQFVDRVQADPAKADLLRRLGSSFEKTAKEMAENDRGLSEGEREDMVKGAEQDLKNFDASKASEIDKSIMLSRLQMRGIDTSDPDAIFKKSPELKAFEGTPFERGFYKIMGLIGFVLAHIEKIKQIGKPKEKKTETPGGKPGETPAGKEGVRKMMRETVPPAINAAALALRKEAERTASRTKIEGDGTVANQGFKKRLQLAKGVQTTVQAELDDLTQQEASGATEELKVQARNALPGKRAALATASANVETLQQRLTQEQATLTRLEGEVKSIKDVQDQVTVDKGALDQAIAMGVIRLGAAPGNEALTGILRKMQTAIDGNGVDLKVDFTDGPTRAQFLQLCEQRGTAINTLNIEIDTANPQFIVAKDAQAFIKALNTVMTKAPAAPAPGPAPAGPGAAPAAPGA